MYRTLRVCSNSGAYEALPDSSRPIDLARVRDQLEEDGIAVVDARVMLIAALEVEVTIGRTGRLLFKTRDEKTAQRCLDRLRPLLDPGAITEPAGPRAPRAAATRGKGSA